MIDSLFKGLFGLESNDYPFGGTGADGEFNATASYNFSDAEGSLVVKNYTSFKIASGYTVSCTNLVKGLVLFVRNNVVINGTIDLDGKAYSNGYSSAGYVIHNEWTSQRKKFLPLYDTLSGLAELYSIQGGAGGNGGNQPGVGIAGSAYGGGNGGGGGNVGYDPGTAGDATAILGGSGVAGVDGAYKWGAGGGGAGNPTAGSHGTFTGAHNQDATDGGEGGGGAIYIFCGGDVIVGTSGIITADGGTGGKGESGASLSHPGSGGGGAGGGIVCIIYKGAYKNYGSVAVSGGSGGASGGGDGTNGDSGSAGTVYTHKYVG